jgi:hypothetical protein
LPNTIGSYCLSALAISTTTVIVVDNLIDEKTLSTSTWTLPTTFEFSWQVAYPIQVRTNANAVASSTGSTASSQQTTTASQAGSSPLSTGSIAGISVSIACSVIDLVFGIGFKVFKYWKQQQKEKLRVTGDDNGNSERAQKP